MTKKEKLLVLKYYVTEYLLETINDNKKIKEYFNKYLVYSTFEIDYYEKKDNYEYVQFDLAAQNTGNIFKYKKNIKTNEYIQMEKPLLCSSKIKKLDISIEILNEIFNIARENSDLIDLEKKLLKRINNI